MNLFPFIIIKIVKFEVNLKFLYLKFLISILLYKVHKELGILCHAVNHFIICNFIMAFTYFILFISRIRSIFVFIHYIRIIIHMRLLEIIFWINIMFFIFRFVHLMN